MFALGSLLLLLVFVPLAIAVFVFWVWMLISAIQNKGLTDSERIVWVIVIILLHALGALLYYCIGHPKQNTPLNPPQTP